MQAGIAAVAPGPLVSHALERSDLTASKTPVRLIATGKAASPMARAALAALGPQLVSAIVVSPSDESLPAPLQLVRGEHPQPGAGSIAAGRAALTAAHSCAETERLLVLLSGGASSLMAVPAEGLTLEDKQATSGLLMRNGADIHALNTVRKHLSALKGGRLALAARGSCLTLAISDVVGDDPSVIGSGPTVPDPSRFADALAVLTRHGGLSVFPPTVVAHLMRGRDGVIPETPKPSDPMLARAKYQVIGGRRTAMTGMAEAATAHGLRVVVLEEPIVGEARTAGPALLAQVLSAASSAERPCCVMASGETTVTVRGPGRGGRNQELALSLVEPLARVPQPIVFASLGSDGVDGPTDAAGAIVDSVSLGRGRALGLDPSAFLESNDSNSYFAGLGDLIRTGPTGTNVGDLQVFLLA